MGKKGPLPRVAPLQRAAQTTAGPAEIRVLVVDEDDGSRGKTVAQLQRDGFHARPSMGLPLPISRTRNTTRHGGTDQWSMKCSNGSRTAGALPLSPKNAFADAPDLFLPVRSAPSIAKMAARL
jgi:hypothetical protein